MNCGVMLFDSMDVNTSDRNIPTNPIWIMYSIYMLRFKKVKMVKIISEFLLKILII